MRGPGFHSLASPIASSASRYFGLAERPASAIIPASPAPCVQSVGECTEGCASCQSATRSITAGLKSEYAVWTYEKPYEAVAAIKEYLAFYPSRVDAIEVLS